MNTVAHSLFLIQQLWIAYCRDIVELRQASNNIHLGLITPNSTAALVEKQAGLQEILTEVDRLIEPGEEAFTLNDGLSDITLLEQELDERSDNADTTATTSSLSVEASIQEELKEVEALLQQANQGLDNVISSVPEEESDSEVVDTAPAPKNKNCPTMQISATCQQYLFVMWDTEGNLVYDSYFEGNVFDDCYDPSKCYVIEFVSESGNCDYEIIMSGQLAQSGTVAYRTGYVGEILKVGNCVQNCQPNEAEIVLITYFDYYGFTYTFHVDNQDYSGEVLEGDSKIFCIDLSKCNLLAKDKFTFNFYYLVDVQTGETLESGDMESYSTFGVCPENCPDESVLIRTDGAFNYSYYEDGALVLQGKLPSLSFSDQLCINPESCYILDGTGTATYYFNKNGTEIAGKGRNNEFRSFGACPKVCDDRPILSATKRGEEIVTKLSTVSGMSELADFNSDRYKAACWLIHDDLRQLEASDPRLIQRYVLVLLYYTTAGPYWYQQGGFLTGKDECDWEIVTACDEDALVKQMYLGENNLTGTFSSEIYNLISLEIFEIDLNSLYGTIPVGMSRLSKLKDLGMGKNKFTGTVPGDFVNLPNIELLYISENLLTGTVPSNALDMSKLDKVGFYDNLFTGTLPSWIYEAPKLSHLSFHRNQLTGSLPEALVDLQYMESIFLLSNLLSGTIPSNIFVNTSLRELRLQDNRLTGAIPSMITNFDVTLVALSNNFLTGTIPSSLAQFEKLNQLYLNGNRLSGTFPEDLVELENLLNGRFENNNLTGTVPFVDCNFTILSSDCSVPQNVDCVCCTSCFGIYTSYEDVLPCPTTEVTIFYDTSINDRLFFQLENTARQLILEDLVNARTVGLYYNTCASPTDCLTFTSNADAEFDIYVNGETLVQRMSNPAEVSFGYSSDGTFKLDTCNDYLVCDTIIPAGSAKRKLFNIIAKFSDLDKFDIQYSPHNIAMCWWLRDIDRYSEAEMQNTALIQRYILAMLYYVTSGDQWYNSLGWLSDDHECNWFGVSCDIHDGLISRISLSSNNLAGALPQEIGELRGLHHLILSNNKLVRKLPIQIVQLSQLETLIISGNRFDGSIHNEIELLTELRELDISSNRFSSTIPSGIGLLEHLESLNAMENALAGEIPTQMGNLNHLKSLYLSSNLLNGALDMIENFTALEYLELSFNYFTGRLPIFGESQKHLKSLVLDNNQFTGPIPSGVEALSSLESFIISDNSITGSLPSQLGKLSSISKLAASYNLLKGTITPELSNIRSLSLLHLHSNSLEGEADYFNYQIDSFITDCGSTEVEPNPVDCFTCTQCCNTEGDCITTSRTWPRFDWGMQMQTAAFIGAVTIGLALAMFLISLILNRMKRCLPRVPFIVRADFNDGSVFRFFMSRSPTAWCIGIISFLGELWIAYMFTKAGDITESGNLWVYSEDCPSDSFECQDQSITNENGWISFTGILAVFLLPDLLNGAYLLYECSIDYDIKGVIAAIVLLDITILSIIASTIFIYATSISNINIIQDAVIALFLNSIDEQLYMVVQRVAPGWTEEIEGQIINASLEKVEISEIIDDDDVDEDDEDDEIDYRRRSSFVKDEGETLKNFWDSQESSVDAGVGKGVGYNDSIRMAYGELMDEEIYKSDSSTEKNSSEDNSDDYRAPQFRGVSEQQMSRVELFLYNEIKQLKKDNERLQKRNDKLEEIVFSSSSGRGGASNRQLTPSVGYRDSY